MIRIFFLNQGAGALLRECVSAAAETIGPVVYATPDRFSQPVPNVRRVALPRHRNSSAAARLWGWFTFLWLGGWRVLFEPGKPLLFIVTNPPLAPLIGYLAKKLKRQRYVLLFYDLYPEALERFAGLPPRSVVARVWRAINRAAVRRADRVITISPDLAHTLAQYGPRRVDIVPTWVDTDRIKPLPKDQNPFARQHGLVDKLAVLYSGNLGTVHDLTVLPAMADRLRECRDLQFVVIGEGAGRQALVAECERRNLKNVLWLPLQDEATLPYSLAAGDVGLVALAAGAEGISMPSKTYYVMAAGSAVLGLCRPGSDLDQVITRHACGVSAAPDDVERATQAILEWRAHPDRLRQHQAQARRAAEQFYSRAVCVPQLLSLIREWVS